MLELDGSMRSAWHLIGWVVAIVLVAVAAVVSVIASVVAAHQVSIRVSQSHLAPFYQAPVPIPTALGTVIRTQPLGISVPDATSLRMLYTTQRPDGTAAVSGAMVFISHAPAPTGGRPVVAWAHGTLGMGDACAPSRSTKPIGDMSTWLPQMMHLGWDVVATDYAGLGTTGPNLYLVGQAEARDVVNSVRAVRKLPEADAGSSYVVFGHSQGGHSALWTGALSKQLAPELHLLGVAAAAPAAQLTDIMGAQWQTVVGWVIGPEVVLSWPHLYPDLRSQQVVSATGQSHTTDIANQCITQAALVGQARTLFGQRYFSANPLSRGGWAAAAAAQAIESCMVGRFLRAKM